MTLASKTFILSPFTLGLRLEIPQLSPIDDLIKKAEQKKDLTSKIFFGHLFFVNAKHQVVFPRQPINIGHHLEDHNASLISLLEIIEQQIKTWLGSQSSDHLNITPASIGAFIIALPIIFSSSSISPAKLKSLYNELATVSDQNPSKSLPGFKVQVFSEDVSKHILVIYNHQHSDVVDWIEGENTLNTLFDSCQKVFMTHPITDQPVKPSSTQSLSIDDIKTRTIQDQESTPHIFVDFRKNILHYYKTDEFKDEMYQEQTALKKLIDTHYNYVKNHLFHLDVLFDDTHEIGEKLKNIISSMYQVNTSDIDVLIEKENIKKEEFKNFKHIFTNTSQTDYSSLMSQLNSQLLSEIGPYFILDFERPSHSDHDEIKSLAYGDPNALKYLYKQFKATPPSLFSTRKIIYVDQDPENWIDILKEFFTSENDMAFKKLLRQFNRWKSSLDTEYEASYEDYFNEYFDTIKDVIKKFGFTPIFGWVDGDEMEFFTNASLSSYEHISFETFSRCISVYLYTIASPRFNNVLRHGTTYIDSLISDGLTLYQINNVEYTETLLDVFQDDRFLLNELKTDLMLFRGDTYALNWFFDKAEGQFLIDKAFFSTSTNLMSAKAFIEDHPESSLYFIYVPKFAATDKNKPKLLVVGDLATPNYRSEKEVLIPPGGLFYILNIESMKHLKDSQFFSSDIQRLLEKYEGYIHHLLYMGDMMNESLDQLHAAKAYLEQLNHIKTESVMPTSFKNFVHKNQRRQKQSKIKDQLTPIENDMTLVKKFIQHPQLAKISDSAKQILKLIKVKS